MCARSIVSASSEGNFGGQGRNLVVPGPKACGKSTFLKTLVEFVTALKIPRVKAVYVDCQGLEDTWTLVSILNRYCRWKITPNDDDADGHFEAIQAHLQATDTLLFLVLDEFDRVYRRSAGVEAKAGQRLVKTLVAFNTVGSNHLLRFVLSGSSACLRGLCFCKLPAELRGDFPAYALDMDLNDRKSVPQPLWPVRTFKEFRPVLQSMDRSGIFGVATGTPAGADHGSAGGAGGEVIPDVADHDALARELFLFSRGRLDWLDELLHEGKPPKNTDSRSAEANDDIVDTAPKVDVKPPAERRRDLFRKTGETRLAALEPFEAACLKVLVTHCPRDSKDVAAVIPHIGLSAFMTYLPIEHRDAVTTAVLSSMSDRGLLWFDAAAKQLFLVHPADVLLQFPEARYVMFQELMAMWSPTGGNKAIHECLVLEALGNSEKGKQTPVKFGRGCTCQFAFSGATLSSYADLEKVFAAVQKDKAVLYHVTGAIDDDCAGFAVFRTGLLRRRIVLVFVQIKMPQHPLGDKKIGVDNTADPKGTSSTSIINRFRDGKFVTEATALAKTFFKKAPVTKFLVATAFPVTRHAADEFADGVHVKGDMTVLANGDMVARWASRVVQGAKNFNLDHFYVARK